MYPTHSLLSETGRTSHPFDGSLLTELCNSGLIYGVCLSTYMYSDIPIRRLGIHINILLVSISDP